MADTFTIEAEYTDTFGGEANYCWVRRATLEMPCGLSDRAIMRRVKRELGLSGMRGRVENYGDEWTFKPWGRCTIMMARVVY